MTPGQVIPKRNEPRYPSDLIISVKISKWNPFSKVKARLLDISWSGFQIEFFKSISLKNEKKIRLEIPLDKLNGAIGCIRVEAIVKWFDEQQFKAGGIYAQKIPAESINKNLEKLIHYVAKQKKNEDNQARIEIGNV